MRKLIFMALCLATIGCSEADDTAKTLLELENEGDVTQRFASTGETKQIRFFANRPWTAE